MGECRVLLADDHPLILEALALAVRSRLPGCSVDSVASIAEAEAAARARQDYNLVLLDYRLPDTEGFSGYYRLLSLLPRVPIAIISSDDQPSLIAAAKAAGAAGFLPKSETVDALGMAIDRLLSGQRVFQTVADDQADIAEIRRRVHRLPEGQKRVLAALVKGHDNKQIAENLNLAESTVKAHLTRIFRKLDVSNRVQTILAVRALFEPDNGS